MRPHEAVPMQDSPLIGRVLARLHAMPSILEPRYRPLIWLPRDPRFDALRIAACDRALWASSETDLEITIHGVEVPTIVVVADLGGGLDVPALSDLADALWPDVRVLDLDVPRAGRHSGTFPSAALTEAELLRRYLIDEEQGRSLRSQERADAQRFIDLYGLDGEDAAAVVLYFHGLERRVVAALLGDGEEGLAKRHSESLYRKTGVRSLRELRIRIAAFVADSVTEGM